MTTPQSAQLSPLAVSLRRNLTSERAIAVGQMLEARPATLDGYRKLLGLRYLLNEAAETRRDPQLESVADAAADASTRVFMDIARDTLPEGGTLSTNRIESANLLATDGEAVGLVFGAIRGGIE